MPGFREKKKNSYPHGVYSSVGETHNGIKGKTHDMLDMCGGKANKAEKRGKLWNKTTQEAAMRKWLRAKTEERREQGVWLSEERVFGAEKTANVKVLVRNYIARNSRRRPEWRKWRDGVREAVDLPPLLIWLGVHMV